MYFGFRHNATAKILIILHKTKKKQRKSVERKIKKWGKRDQVFVKSSIFAAEETKQHNQDNEEDNNHETSLFTFPVATMF